MKKVLKAVGFTLLILGMYLLVSVGVGLLLAVVITVKEMIGNSGRLPAGFEEKLMDAFASLVGPITVGTNLIALLIIMLLFLARKDKFFKYVQFRKIKVTDGALLAVFGVFLNFLIVGLTTLSFEFLPIQNQVQAFEELMAPIYNSGLIPLLIIVSVSAPFFEEIVFRGIIFNDFKKATPLWVAMLIQAVCFGAFHMNWIQGVYATALGIVLGLVYQYYKSIWAAILLHFVYNTTSVLLDRILPDSVNMFVVSAIGLAGTCGLAIILRKMYIKEDYEVDTEQLPVEIVEETL